MDENALRCSVVGIIFATANDPKAKGMGKQRLGQCAKMEQGKGKQEHLLWENASRMMANAGIIGMDSCTFHFVGEFGEQDETCLAKLAHCQKSCRLRLADCIFAG